MQGSLSVKLLCSWGMRLGVSYREGGDENKGTPLDHKILHVGQELGGIGHSAHQVGSKNCRGQRVWLASIFSEQRAGTL